MIKRVFKWIGMIILLGVVVIVLGLAGVYGWLEHARHKVGREYAINSPRGIDRIERMIIGGVPQYIQVRGENTNNPALLFLHGGPGKADMSWSYPYQRELEKHFIVARWDQRGAGKSFSSDIPRSSMTIPQFVADTREVAQWLARSFGQSAIFLVGHSWGSALGMLTIKEHPDLFRAFVGAGQFVNLNEQRKHSYAFVMQAARQANDRRAMADLEAIGPPPYGTNVARAIYILDGYITAFGGELYGQKDFGSMLRHTYVSPYYSLADFLLCYPRGMLFSFDTMLDSVQAINLRAQVTEVTIPVYFFQGRHDFNTASPVVEEYFALLKAPMKRLIWFEKSAHSPPNEEPEKFQTLLINTLLGQDTEPGKPSPE